MCVCVCIQFLFVCIMFQNRTFIESRSSNHSNSAIQTKFSQNEQQLLRKSSETAKKLDTSGGTTGAISKQRSLYNSKNGDKVTHSDISYSAANRTINKSHSNENECECSSTSVQSLIESKSKMICNSKISNSNNINKANIRPSSDNNNPRQMNYNELETKIRQHVFSVGNQAKNKLALRSSGTLHLAQNATSTVKNVMRRSRTAVIESCKETVRKRSAEPKVCELDGLHCSLREQQKILSNYICFYVGKTKI